MHEKALQSQEEDTEKAAQEEAENEALLEALEREVLCAQQVDLSEGPTAIDLSDEVVVTHERRTTDVAGSGSRFGTQPTASQEAAWAEAGEAAWDAGTAAAEQPAQPAAAEEPASGWTGNVATRPPAATCTAAASEYVSPASVLS